MVVKLEQQNAIHGLLYDAVNHNQHHLVHEHIDNGADPNHVVYGEEKHVRTPLRRACVHGDVKVIRLLLKKGATLFAHSVDDRWSVLHSAADAGHDHILRLLVIEADELHENVDVDGFSLLHIAAEILNPRMLNGGADFLHWLLRHLSTFDVNVRSRRPGYYDWTPFHICAHRGKVKAAMLLIRVGAKIHLASGEFHLHSPLMNQYSRGDCAQFASTEQGFLALHGSVCDKGLLPIHCAAIGGYVKMLHFLIKHDQSIYATTAVNRWTPLMFGVWSNSVPFVNEVCLRGSNRLINSADRRGDSLWTPLSLAVMHGSIELVQTLISHGADPLVQVRLGDFPGTGFIQNTASSIQDSQDNCWSTTDSRISLLHLAVVRGNLEMLRIVMQLVDDAYFNTVGKSKSPLHLVPWHDAIATPRRKKNRGALGPMHTAPLNAPREAQKQLAQALTDISYEALQRSDRDPLTACTSAGWSPAILALILHAADSRRQVRFKFIENFPEDVKANSRADVFVELLKTGRAFCEDHGDASPPLVSGRFYETSELLLIRAIDELMRLCREAKCERTGYVVCHATLCAACRFNRFRVAKHLLERKICDPQCLFFSPIACRPIHISSRLGFGQISQLLIDHDADPTEVDEQGDKPVLKITRFYNQQIQGLKSKVSSLQSQIRTAKQQALAAGLFEGDSSAEFSSAECPIDTLLLSSRM